MHVAAVALCKVCICMADINIPLNVPTWSWAGPEEVILGHHCLALSSPFVGENRRLCMVASVTSRCLLISWPPAQCKSSPKVSVPEVAFCWCVCIHIKQCRLPVTLLALHPWNKQSLCVPDDCHLCAVGLYYFCFFSIMKSSEIKKRKKKAMDFLIPFWGMVYAPKQ